MRKKVLISSSLGTLLVLVGVIGILSNLHGTLSLGYSLLKPFTSYEELRSFIAASSESQYKFYPDDPSGMARRWGLSPNTLSAEDSSSTLPTYSRTNVQVEGVDEADTVKTDGTYIYVISNQTIIILKAYPPENAQILSKIKFQGSLRGIFINQDKLAAFEDTGYYPEFKEYSNSISSRYTQRTNITVYNIADRTNPTITRNMSVEGSYFNSRMIGNYAYIITNQDVLMDQNNVTIPKISYPDRTEQVPANQIYYSDTTDNFNTYANIASVNLINDKEDPTVKSILIGYASTVYVSQNNIYITYSTYQYQGQTTKIHRIHIDKGEIDYQASGEAPGYVLNQFSMDEYNGYFRIATCSWRIGFGGPMLTRQESTSENNVYILNMDLDTIGSVEDLAPGETIHSARFMGNRCYLVTFKKIDPLFVIDLTNPTSPQVLGQLKVTGYSDYLHPYDENHIIGIGKETVAGDEQGSFAWYQGIKISLFDVTDVATPKEITKYEIGDRGTDSPILNDHKAFLFDKDKNLLVIPVTVAEINPAKYPGGEVPPNTYGDYVWDGAYVFRITLAQGLELQGKITHLENNIELLKSGYYYQSQYSIRRSLYIDNVLYTVSNLKIKMNSLLNMTEINTLELKE